MYCKKCGANISEEAEFCRECGTPVQKEPSDKTENCHPEYRATQGEENTQQNPQQYSQPQVQPMAYGAVNQGYNNYNVPIKNYDPSKDYTPISMWGYFGYQILFAIPIIGFIMILVFALGGTKNINLRNYARSSFCLLIILVVILLLIFITAALASL